MARKFFDIICLNTIILSFTTSCDCHTASNSSDVMVTYEGHSEVGNNANIFYSEQKPEVSRGEALVEDPGGEGGIKAQDQEVKRPATAEDGITDDGVLFVPNEKPVVRNGNVDGEGVHALMRETLSDVMNEKRVIMDTESPNADVVFISGMNKERDEEESKKKESKKEKIADAEVKVVKKINCTNLDCDTNAEPVCGGKVEQKKWRYRMFLNRCFLRKVNCDFRNPVNRYRQVDIQKCKDVAFKSLERPIAVPVRTFKALSPTPAQKETRRFSPSRRSLNRAADGQLCAHTCPVSCTADYVPQCAASASGQKLLFRNHCELDLHSCAHSTAWQQRPLSRCVGGKMADAWQNRGFVSWLQRGGLVDSKGKLTLH